MPEYTLWTLLGMAAVCLGLTLSWYQDTPAGPSVVVAAAGALPEVAGEAALQVPPDSADGYLFSWPASPTSASSFMASSAAARRAAPNRRAVNLASRSSRPSITFCNTVRCGNTE